MFASDFYSRWYYGIGKYSIPRIGWGKKSYWSCGDKRVVGIYHFIADTNMYMYSIYMYIYIHVYN